VPVKADYIGQPALAFRSRDSLLFPLCANAGHDPQQEAFSMTRPFFFFKRPRKAQPAASTTHRLWCNSGNGWQPVADFWPTDQGLLGAAWGMGLLCLLPADQHPPTDD
jgi:hypothetical protein